jgi:hypothetical protein
MTLEQIKEVLKKNVRWEKASSTRRTGGQSCGIEHLPVTLISEDLDFRICISHHRSELKNRELMWTLFELALDEIVK